MIGRCLQEGESDMGAGEPIELHIPSVFGCEKVAMEKVAAVAERMGFSRDRVEDLKTAVAEACLNAIEHGNKLNRTIRVGIELLADDSKLQVSVSDQGEGVGAVPHPDIEAKIAGREPPRGWGIFLIRNLVDEVQFDAKAGGGHEIRMLIHLDRESSVPGSRGRDPAGRSDVP
jgi:serine/threonine-protein kinase RsbW